MDIKNFLQSKYDYERFKEFIFDKFYGFEENDLDYEHPLNETEQKHIQKYKFLGSSELDDSKEIGFFEIITTEKTDIENNRVSLGNILKNKTSNELLDGAIAVFYNPNKPEVWRLSFIKFSYDENNKEQVSNLKRFTYVLGKNIPIKTAYNQLKDFKYPSLIEIEDAFSVEKISKEFFAKYKELYLQLVEDIAVVNKEKITNKEKNILQNKKMVSFYIKKLLGRVVFLYFVQKKGWLNNNRKFITELYETHTKENPLIDFYDEIMEELFFNGLNKNRRDKKLLLGNKEYFIPYLNGGLFESDELDDENLTIPNKDFEKIIELFDSYNFTVIEDTPHDSEIAIDPEMLGRVFEDLLEDRKEKGAFYTPREIVHYMCQQSIINYLLNFYGEDSLEEIKSLVIEERTDTKFIKSNAKNIKKYLEDIKVLDPAIGSGAFPMGMLHEIVAILSNLDKTVDVAQLKRKVIENSIYGVDIEHSAVEIAKLRFWLSIVVDEEEPHPLPNLKYKIMVGNSLLETINGFDPLIQNQNQKGRNELKLLKAKFHKYFNISEIKEKELLNEEIKRNILTILVSSLDNFNIQQSLLMDRNEEKQYLENKKRYDLLKEIIDEYKEYNYSSNIFLYKVYFKEVIDEKGFDIIIGNPPYVGEKGNKDIFRPLQSEFKNRYESNSDLFYFFFLKSIDLLKENGILGFITTNYFLTADGAVRLRDEFKKKMAISNIINFNEMKLFKSALGQHNIITMLQKTKNILDTKIINVLKPQESFNEKIFLESKEVEVFTKKSNKLFDGEKNYIRISKQGNNLEKVFNRMVDNSQLINEICSLGVGFKTGTDKIVKKDIEKVYEVKPNNINLGDGVFILNEEEYTKIKPEDELIYKCHKSSDIKRYSSHNWKNLYVIWTNKNTNIDKYPNIKNHLEKYKNILDFKMKDRGETLPWYSNYRAREYDLFTNKDKIVFPYRSKLNIFSYSNNDYFASGDILYLRQKDKKFDIKYILALLNSKLYYTWLYYKGKRKGEILELYVTPISQVPIKIISEEEQRPFVILVNYIIYLKENKHPEYMSLFFERVIDIAVYELYLKEELNSNDFGIISALKDELNPLNINSEIIENVYKKLSDKNHKVAYNVNFIDTLDIVKTIENK